jgi:uroporphyrinogen-III synthase
MLITRPEPDASVSAVSLRALGIAPVTFPLMRRISLDVSLPEPNGFAALALTSVNALRALRQRDAITRYRNIKVFAVGDRTAEEASMLGFANVVSAGGGFADLVTMLAHAQLAGPVFYPAGKEISGDLGKSLAPFGIMVVTARIYEMVPATEVEPAILADLGDGKIDAALFYSRRTAEIFVSLFGRQLPKHVHTRLGMLCLSENVAAPLMEARFVRISLADHPSNEAMMTLALSFARDQNAPATRMPPDLSTP